MPRPSYGCWLYVRGCCSHGGVHTAHSSPPSVTVELPGTALGGLVGVQVCSRQPGGRGTGRSRGATPEESNASSSTTYDDGAPHAGVYLTMVVVAARFVELVGVALPRMQGPGVERTAVVGHGVVSLTLVDPRDRRSWFDGDRGRREVEVSDGHRLLLLGASVGRKDQYSQEGHCDQIRQSSHASPSLRDGPL
jgi:hypothetical protein